ncbi:MAG: response regulator [Actinobacteria bacterium]|nr:MAG: response regulator [Actinomycetota bacterium]
MAHVRRYLLHRLTQILIGVDVVALEHRLAPVARDRHGDLPVEAVAAVQADPPDLIFMDLGLPRMDGWEATRRIRELPGGSGVRIVALTGHTMRAEHQRAFDVGCDDFIAKPVAKSEVIDQALRRWLPRSVECAPRGAGARPLAAPGTL